MKYDNKQNAYRIWLRRLAMAIIFTLLVIIILFTSWFDNSEAGITKYHVIIAIALIYIIISLVNYLRLPYFLSFSDADEMIILRYYSLSIFNSQKNSIEIPKMQFVKFETEKFFFGIEEKLIVYRFYRNKIAKYPPISLSAVNKSDRVKIKNALQKYVKNAPDQN
ncbi:MAG: hypothetical protein JXR52_12810 [Bacteroidales bacterium]|nr:hypothetical protein [Bacteroidales bacterium]MBN2699699.1 hypothetical protein [Bacteroidales bacterium]